MSYMYLFIFVKLILFYFGSFYVLFEIASYI